MIENFEQTKKILKYQKQEQILEYPIRNKEEFANEVLKINFEQLNKLYDKAIKNEKVENSKIEPIPYIEKDKLSEEEKEHYKKIGENIIRNNEYAVVTMSGVQGSRLGHDGPKGTFDFGLENHKSIFEVLCDRLKEAYKKYNVYIPWYIMTSRQNNEETINFFEKNNYFGYSKENVYFFKQGELPVLNDQGKLMLNKEGNINTAADGHGGIFVSMEKEKITENMKQRGIKWVFIGPVDNVLIKMVDPIFIGICQDKNMLAGGKSIIKAYPEERVGVFCKKDGKPDVIEYTEISKEMAKMKNDKGELVYAESHINCNVFNIDIIEKISKNKLPYHSAHKKIEYLNKEGQVVKPEEPNAYKFEAFIFDAFKMLDEMTIFRVKREEEFAPIKNAEGKDSPETALELYKNFYSNR